MLVVISGHVSGPDWFKQLRNFGTPLLIVVAALAATAAFPQGIRDVRGFLARRLSKLVLMPWIFLGAFFGIVFLYASLRGQPFPFTAADVVDSFSFQGGIGYLWIFRVYMVIALLTPCLLALRGRLQDTKQRAWLLVIAYAFYEALAAFAHASIGNPALRTLVDETVFTVVPFALMFAYGMLLRDMRPGAIVVTGLVGLAVFAGLALVQVHAGGAFVPTQRFKYPPRLYYLSYAVFWINAVVLVAWSDWAARLPARALTWFSTNGLWIYLWHILALFAWNLKVGAPDGHLGKAAVMFVSVVAFAIVVTALQNRLLARITDARSGMRRLALRSMQG